MYVVCMHICMHACTYIFIRVWMYEWRNACMDVCIIAWSQLHTYVHRITRRCIESCDLLNRMLADRYTTTHTHMCLYMLIYFSPYRSALSHSTVTIVWPGPVVYIYDTHTRIYIYINSLYIQIHSERTTGGAYWSAHESRSHERTQTQHTKHIHKHRALSALVNVLKHIQTDIHT